MPRNSIYIIALILFAAPSLTAQSAPAANAKDVQEGPPLPVDGTTPKPLISTFSSDMGYSYTYPSGWEVVDMKPAMPVIRQKVEESATSAEEKKGAECAQIDLMLRNRSPLSMIEIMSMKNNCFDMKLNSDNLAAFGLSVDEGLKKSLDVSNPVYSAYKLGSHRMWIEKATASIRNSTLNNSILEVSCTILHKGFICLVTFAHDSDALNIFESGKVTLDEDAPIALVPEGVFDPKKTGVEVSPVKKK